MSDIKLPPLPEPDFADNGDCFGHESVNGYVAEAMQAYARQAALMERERCAAICEWEALSEPQGGSQSPDAAYNLAIEHCAAAIREQSLRELNRLSEDMGEVK